MTTPIDRVLDRLRECGCDPKPTGNRQWSFRCPCEGHKHGDRNPSGSLGIGADGKALLWCALGHKAPEIGSRIGVDMQEMFPESSEPKAKPKIVARYVYTDEDEIPLYRVNRWEPGFKGEDKSFRPEHPNGTGGWVTGQGGGRKVLYRLPDVLATIAEEGTVYLCAGEKDAIAVNNVEAEGNFIATTKPFGEQWDSIYNETLSGAHVVIVQDRDEQGRRYAADVLAHLDGVAASVRVVEAKQGKDAHNHLAAGCGLEDFVPLDESPTLTAPEPVDQADGFEWRGVDFAEWIDSEPEPEAWVFGGLIERDEVSVLTAFPKDGKTWTMMQLALDGIRGRAGLGVLPIPKPIRVLWIDEEMGTRKLKRRFRRLCAGAGVPPDELHDIAQRINIRPQQGLSLGDGKHIDTVRRAIEDFQPDLIIMDSLVALSQGEENSATDRRRFYNQVLAPLKADYDCGILVAAHPPLPSKDAHGDSKKRPRGSGDIIAQVDRAFWMSQTNRIETPTEFTVRSTLESYVSREAGDLEPIVVIIDGPAGQPVTITAEYAGSVEGQRQIGKVHACEMKILSILRLQSVGESRHREMYQPDLKDSAAHADFDKDIYADAIKGLTAQNLTRVDSARPGTGKSGKWVVLMEDDE